MDANSRIFITGGTGMLGSYVLRYLVSAGFTNVHALKRDKSPMSLVEDVVDKITWHEGDIEDPVSLEDGMAGSEFVFHVAGLVSHEDREADRLLQVNQQGTTNIVDTCLYLGVRRLIHVSSIAAIGRFKNQVNYDEKFIWQDSPLNSWYAISKMLAEQEVYRSAAEGLDVVVLNPAQVLGGGFWDHGTGRLFHHVWASRPFYPKGSTGWIDARDLARFAIECMFIQNMPQRVILSSEHHRYKQILFEIAQGLDMKGPHTAANQFIAGISWRLQALRYRLIGVKPDITRISAKNSARDFNYNATLSKRVNPNFRFTPIKRTIAELCSLYIYAQKEGKSYAILPLTRQDDLRKAVLSYAQTK